LPSSAAFGVTTALLMYALILIGSVVRTTGSGLACPDWPLCQGRLIPRFEFHVLIEWFHRLLALLVSLNAVRDGRLDRGATARPAHGSVGWRCSRSGCCSRRCCSARLRMEAAPSLDRERSSGGGPAAFLDPAHPHASDRRSEAEAEAASTRESAAGTRNATAGCCPCFRAGYRNDLRAISARWTGQHESRGAGMPGVAYL